MSYAKTKIILVLVGLITTSLAAIFVYECISIQKTKERVLAVRAELASEKESLNSFNALVKTTSNIKADSEKAATFFIKKDEVSNFLDVVEGLASSTQTNISVKSVGEKKIQDTAVLSLDINIVGTYKNVYYALSMLQELPYQTEIQNINLSLIKPEEGKKDQGNMWSADVQMVGIMF